MMFQQTLSHFSHLIYFITCFTSLTGCISIVYPVLNMLNHLTTMLIVGLLQKIADTLHEIV